LSPKLARKESEISERNLSLEKREKPLMLKTNAAADIYSLTPL
jgi:hypothetical protein